MFSPQVRPPSLAASPFGPRPIQKQWKQLETFPARIIQTFDADFGYCSCTEHVAVTGGFSLLLQRIHSYKENLKISLEVKEEHPGASVEAQAACGAGEIEFLLGLVTGGWCWVWERL